MYLDIVILSSAIIPDTTKRDQSSLDFFEFGESIPVVAYLCLVSGGLCGVISYFLRSFGLSMMFSGATGEHPSFLSRSSP